MVLGDSSLICWPVFGVLVPIQMVETDTKVFAQILVIIVVREGLKKWIHPHRRTALTAFWIIGTTGRKNIPKGTASNGLEAKLEHSWLIVCISEVILPLV